MKEEKDAVKTQKSNRKKDIRKREKNRKYHGFNDIFIIEDGHCQMVNSHLNATNPKDLMMDQLWG